jgi:hypothetical protein
MIKAAVPITVMTIQRNLLFSRPQMAFSPPPMFITAVPKEDAIPAATVSSTTESIRPFIFFCLDTLTRGAIWEPTLKLRFIL